MSNYGCATVARLRPVLARYFAEKTVDTILRRLREAGLLRNGASGHGGARSAELGPKQVAITLIALALDVPPIAAADEARRVADFRLRFFDRTHSSNPSPTRRHLDSCMTLLDALAGEIVATAGAIADFEQYSWLFSRYQAQQLAPERLVFTPREQPFRLPAVQRETHLPARLICDVVGRQIKLDP